MAQLLSEIGLTDEELQHAAAPQNEACTNGPPALWYSADFIAFASGASVSNGKAHGDFTGAWPDNAQVALLPGTAVLSKSATGNFLRLGADSTQIGQAIGKVFVQS